MSDKFIFQNARIKSMENRLLGQQQLQRLAEASSVREMQKALGEMGFGIAAAGENAGVDRMIEAEEKNALAVLKEFNVDGALDALVLEADYHNLKALFKASVTGEKNPVLGAEGLYDTEVLRDGTEGDYYALRPLMADAVRAVEKSLAEGRLTPHGIDCTVDKAMFRDISETAKKGGEAVKEYYVFKTDCVNISSFLRCRRLGLPEKLFEENFMPGGTLGEDFFLSVYDASLDVFRDKFKFTPYQSLVAEAVDGGNLVAFEVQVDNLLLDMWRKRKDDMFSCAPVVGYYFGKLAEIKAVKLVFAGVKNNVEPRLIKERMRDIYGA